ncbi:MAG: MerR family transcriptional regulator [Deferribacterota bacterium]|nr:MerR family transcriptional regulator [Deferribacterota bacterium]
MESNKLYYKIGEVCEITNLKPSVLRFWEKQFKQLKPLKVGSNHRYYTQEHIKIIKDIKHMLYEEKLTIEGAKLKLGDSCRYADSRGLLKEVKKELLEILSLIKHDI